jgi:hypothetical protein
MFSSISASHLSLLTSAWSGWCWENGRYTVSPNPVYTQEDLLEAGGL